MQYLIVENLNKTIGKEKLLSDISFSVEKGSINLIAGPNGSGKSLLLKCLKGIEKIDSGKIIYCGEEKKKRRDRMNLFGLVMQDTSLQIVGQTVKKDIRFGLENQNRKVEEIERITEEMLSLFSLKEIENKDPNVLSGGEKRRLSIAGVLAMQAEVLLLDEPLANLDYPSVLMVLKTLKELKEKNITTLIVSHEAEKLLSLTDNTILLKEGKVVEVGKSREMIDKIKENSIYLPNLPFEEITWLK